MSNSRRQFGVRRPKRVATALWIQSGVALRLPPHSKLALVLLLLTAHNLLLTGCRRDMQDQPKAIAYRESSFYKDGSGSRPLVEGTVPRGYLREDRGLYQGKKATAQPSPGAPQTPSTQAAANSQGGLYPDDVDTIPMPLTKDDLDRGQERYDIYCSVCHGKTGYGDGMIARRGFNKPSPANYHQDRLRQAPAGHFFDVMTNGWGAMPAYNQQLSVEDRWRIVAYIRALQLSQMPAGSNSNVNGGNSPAKGTGQ
jgi:mono/diheme cytochrome c family protein